jgi:hypothetical protein
VLEKLGFQLDGRAQQGDAIVWRYSLARPAGER